MNRREAIVIFAVMLIGFAFHAFVLDNLRKRIEALEIPPAVSYDLNAQEIATSREREAAIMNKALILECEINAIFKRLPKEAQEDIRLELKEKLAKYGAII